MNWKGNLEYLISQNLKSYNGVMVEFGYPTLSETELDNVIQITLAHAKKNLYNHPRGLFNTGQEYFHMFQEKQFEEE